MRSLIELTELLSGAAECLSRVSNEKTINKYATSSANDNRSLILFESLSCPKCGNAMRDSKVNSENRCGQCGISFLMFQCNWCSALLISFNENIIVCSNCHQSLDIRICGYCRSVNYYLGQSQLCVSCGRDIHNMNIGHESLYFILVLQILILKQLELECKYDRSVFFKEYSRLFSDENYVKNRIAKYWGEFPSGEETINLIEQLARQLSREDIIISLHQILKIISSESRISSLAINLIRNIFGTLGLNQSEISYFISEYFFVYGIDTFKESSIPSELMKYFLIMDLKTDSTVDDVKKKYREMALKYHPDRNIGNNEDAIRSNTLRFMSIQEAYDVLFKYLS